MLRDHPAYHFRAMQPMDLDLVNGWLETPLVSRWWIDANGQPADRFTIADLEAADVSMLVVAMNGRPFAFIQDYDPHAWPGHHFSDLPPASRGIDQFIGVPGMIGAGHGPRFIAQHVRHLFASGAPVVGTDPHPSNERAIRAYGKAGFRGDAACMTAWGESRFMTIWRD